MIGDRVVVDFGDGPLLRADAACEIPEMIDGQRDIRSLRFPDRLAVVDGLGKGEDVEVLLHPVSDLVQNAGTHG